MIAVATETAIGWAAAASIVALSAAGIADLALRHWPTVRAWRCIDRPDHARTIRALRRAHQAAQAELARTMPPADTFADQLPVRER